MSFVGRQRELSLLRDAYHGASAAMVPVYGRRRVGKSELLLRFLDEHGGVYHLGKQAPAPLQIRDFLRAAAAAVDEPLLAELQVDGWEQALRRVVERWRGDGKLVLVLDEFQWTAGASPELPSVLQGLWDREWKRSGRVMLILCGSYVGFMEREVLGRESPLFGRRTAQIHLQPFDHREARHFHPGYGVVESARTYFVCGGVPAYLERFDDARSVEANIRDNFLDDLAPLFREPDFLLREELRELHNYYAILMALASGSASVAEVARVTGIPARSLPYYLNQLIELRYVRRRYPLVGDKRSVRDVRYTLDDPLLRFWFRFVYPDTSLIPRLGPERAFEQRVRPQLDAWFGLCFESLCREALPLLYEREGVVAAFETGEYWSRETQIDVVSVRDDGWIDLGECKWGAVRSPAAVARALEEKVARYPNPKNATIARRVFTRDAVQAPESTSGAPVRWHDLGSLYGE